MTRQDALELLQRLPEAGGSLSLCGDVNPELLAVWSRLKGRIGHSDVWTELDVAESARLMLVQHIRHAVIGGEL